MAGMAGRSVSETPSVHQRIVAVMAEMPALGKTRRNEQQNFMYRGHDDVMNALTPLLAKHGVHVVPDVVERIVGERQTRSGGTMYEVNLHVRFRFYGASGDFVEASGWGEGTDSGDKATNKAMTMAFKYVLAQVFALSTEESVDADATTPEETVRRKSAAPHPTGGAPATEAADSLTAVMERLAGLDPQTDWPTALDRTAREQYREPGGLAKLTQQQRDHLAGRMVEHADKLAAALAESAGEPQGASEALDVAQAQAAAASSPAEQSPFKAPAGPRGAKAKEAA